MKTITKLLIIYLVSISAASAAGDVSLYNSAGQATAYVSEDATIYLWAGTPVAYLDLKSDRNAISIYGYNGKHLGWFHKGLIYAADGKAVGGVREAFAAATKPPPLKGLKELKPLKSLKELRPLKPLFVRQWSRTTLTTLLFSGASQ